MVERVHQDLPVLHVGDPAVENQQIVILLHGRGATAESMIGLAEALYSSGTLFLIPQAYSNRWYPQTAFGPLEPNEPDLSSGLQVIDDLINEMVSTGFSKDQIFIGGFSQGACLGAEYVVRNPDRYGGLFVLSGALIGPPDEKRNPAGDLDGTPVFIGGSDVDPWVKKDYFLEAERVLSSLGGSVEMRIYPGMGHVINDDELLYIKELIAGVK
jgi:predicted esterase